MQDGFKTQLPYKTQNLATTTFLNDFRKMIVTIMKIHYKNQSHSIHKLQNVFKRFFKWRTRNELMKIDKNSAEFSDFDNAFISVLNKISMIGKSS